MAIEPNNPPLHDSVRNGTSLAEPHHGRVHYSQSRATLSVTNFWGGPGVSPYATNTPNDGIILDPSLCGNDFWDRQAMDFNQQILHAAPWGNQYIGSSFRGANMPAQGTNPFTEGINDPYYTHRSTLQYIPGPQVADEFGLDHTNFPHYPSVLSIPYISPPATGDVEEVESCAKRGRRRRLAPRSDAHRHSNIDQSASQSQHFEKEQIRSSRPRKAAPPHHASGLHPRELISTGNEPIPENPRYKEVDEDKFVLIQNEWSM